MELISLVLIHVDLTLLVLIFVELISFVLIFVVQTLLVPIFVEPVFVQHYSMVLSSMELLWTT